MGAEHSQAELPDNLQDLIKESKYTSDELREWYGDFKQQYPQCIITTEQFVEYYLHKFPNTKARVFTENVFRLFDTNGDGMIDFRELVTTFGLASRGSREEKLKWMFSLYDIDGDGNITEGEMRIVLKSLVHLVTTGKAQANIDEKVEERLKMIFDEVDKDHDGLITLEEFLQIGNTNTIFMEVLEKGIVEYAPK